MLLGCIPQDRSLLIALFYTEVWVMFVLSQLSVHHVWATELTTRFGWESVRLILRDLGHCPRRRSRRGQWARSRGINSDSHTKRVDNSGSATTVLATKYLFNDAKCLFLSERWVFFLTCRPSLMFWSRHTNRQISIKKMGLLPCQPVVVPAKTFFCDYCPASRV